MKSQEMPQWSYDSETGKKIFIEELIDNLPEVFFLVDENLRFIRWNRNLEAVTGYSDREIATMNPLDFFGADDRKMIAGKMQSVFKCGKASAEAYIRCKNGRKIPYLFNGSRTLLDGLPHLICTGLDISERYEIDETLYKLSRAVEQSSSSILITDTSGRIEYANSSFLQLTGYDLEEVIGRYTSRAFAILPEPETDCPAWQSFAASESWPVELRNRKKSGEYFWESVCVSPIKNADEVTTHYLIEKENITPRKLAEREVLKSRAELVIQHEKLKSLFIQVETSKKEWENTMDCIADIVILTDTRNRIKRHNNALAELVGMTHQQLEKRDWVELLAENGLRIPLSCEQDKEIYHEPSGRWFVFNSYPFRDDCLNEVSGAVITLHDITVVKGFTSELENAYSELKATQAKVVQQEKMASIGQLAAGVAHEINNPMGFISSNLNTLGKYVERLNDYISAQSEILATAATAEAAEAIRAKRKALKVDYILDDVRELISESLDGAERVRTIVGNLKSFSRVDEAEHKHADVNECITSTINIVWNELKYRANLVKDLGDIPLTRCYPQQLNQVFMNLLVNAAHAIEEHGDITVRTRHENGSIFASVTDTGCGMTPEVMNRIFEPFYTTKAVGKGTGLGLSITYDIVKKHNGEILVESVPGRGTTFTVRLPVVDGK